MIIVGHISTVQEWFKITTRYDDHYLLSMPKSYIILNEKWEEKKLMKPGEAECWVSVWTQGQLSTYPELGAVPDWLLATRPLPHYLTFLCFQFLKRKNEDSNRGHLLGLLAKFNTENAFGTIPAWLTVSRIYMIVTSSSLAAAAAASPGIYIIGRLTPD